jgi:putative nucleotidyltransferase with HDIG domain
MVRAFGARPRPEALALVRERLTDRQRRLFAVMSPRDQWHAIETARLLHEAGFEDPDLESAALFHDAGKGYIRLHERVLFVLLARYPPLLRRVARGDGSGWRGSLYRSAVHAEAGARLAREAGLSDRAVRLIATHHAPDPSDAEAVALLDADERA